MLTVCNHLMFYHGSLNANILLMQCNQTCALSPSDSLTNGLPRNRIVIMMDHERNHTWFNKLPCNQTGEIKWPILICECPYVRLNFLSDHLLQLRIRKRCCVLSVCLPNLLSGLVSKSLKYIFCVHSHLWILVQCRGMILLMKQPSYILMISLSDMDSLS